MLFNRICRDNGITRRLTRPLTDHHGKIERLHQAVQRELVDLRSPFTDIEVCRVVEPVNCSVSAGRDRARRAEHSGPPTRQEVHISQPCCASPGDYLGQVFLFSKTEQTMKPLTS